MTPSNDQRRKKVLIKLNIVRSVKITGYKSWLEKFCVCPVLSIGWSGKATGTKVALFIYLEEISSESKALLPTPRR
jgi:hypothetical protein